MREGLYKSYSLKGTELGLLLSAVGCNTAFTVPFISGSETRADYLYAMEHMAKTGIIEPCTDGFVIKEPYGSLINHIASSPKVVLLKTSDDSIPDYCIHFTENESILVIYRSPYKKDSVLLTVLDTESFVKDFLSQDFLPVQEEDSLEPENEDASEIVLEMLAKLRNGEKIDDVRFMLGVHVLDTETEKEKSLIIASLARGIFMMSFDEIGGLTEIYTKNTFSDRLYEMTGGLKLI